MDQPWKKPGDRPPLYENAKREQAERGILSHMGDGSRGYYRQFLQGEPIAKGGTGTVWFCECPNGNLYPVHLCRHIRTIQESSKSDHGLSRKVKLTNYGKRRARKCGCAV